MKTGTVVLVNKHVLLSFPVKFLKIVARKYDKSCTYINISIFFIGITQYKKADKLLYISCTKIKSKFEN